MNDTELGWLAGIIDGEGNFSIRHRINQTKSLGTRLGFYGQLVVTNTNKEIIDRCYKLTGVGSVYYRDKKPPSKRLWHWRVASTGLREIIPKLIPHLCKREEAEIIRDAMKITSKRNSVPSGGTGKFRTDDEIRGLFKFRDRLLDLHGLNARKLATITSPEPYCLNPLELTDIK